MFILVKSYFIWVANASYIRKMQKKQNSKFCIITNDKKNFNQTDLWVEPDVDLEEEFKLKSSDYNNKNTENPESWIDIKQATDGLSNITIREM